jgi:chromosome segregation ATPase
MDNSVELAMSVTDPEALETERLKRQMLEVRRRLTETEIAIDRLTARLADLEVVVDRMTINVRQLQQDNAPTVPYNEVP